jgi:hypothetical protein
MNAQQLVERVEKEIPKRESYEKIKKAYEQRGLKGKLAVQDVIIEDKLNRNKMPSKKEISKPNWESLTPNGVAFLNCIHRSQSAIPEVPEK